MKKSKYIRKPTTSLKTLVVAMASLAVVSTSQADVKNKQIGDLEIFQSAQKGGATVSLMLDTSGSMGFMSIKEDYNDDCFRNGKNAYYIFDHTVPVIDKDGNPYTPRPNVKVKMQGCGGWTTDTANLDRISRLKKALIEMLANGKILDETYKIGAGNYSTYGMNRSGFMGVSAAPLTMEHRLKLIDYINSLVAVGSTPSAAAYAEIGAYMMGTTTLLDPTSNKETRVIPYGQSNRDGSGWWHPNICEHIDPNFKINNNKRGSFSWYSCGAAKPIHNVAGKKTPIETKEYFPIANYHIITSTTGIETTYPNQVHVPAHIHFGNKIHTYWSASDSLVSGFPFSATNTKKTDELSYQSPIINEESKCDGQGIFFLTDGEPNNNNEKQVSEIMAKSLNRSSFTPSDDLPNVGAYYNSYLVNNNGISYYAHGAPGWRLIGAYAKALRDTSNPSKKDIKTATLGFGKSFTTGVDENTGKVSSCDVLPTVDAKNLCKWGQDPTLGGGGFTATSKAEIVSKSIENFALSLNSDGISAIPSGVIIVPDDPYNLGEQQSVAYYPMIQADVASNKAIWLGNVKKYNINDGSLFGKNNKKLFKNFTDAYDIKNFRGDLDPDVQDLWSDKDNSGKNNEVESGGFYAQLKTPNGGVDNVRTLYIEDEINPTTGKGKLKKFAVNSRGEVTVDGNRYTRNSLTDRIYTEDVLKDLLKFLGFDNLPSGNIANMRLNANNVKNSIKTLGATIHSRPAAVSYSANINDDGTIDADNREEYVLFGSSDGALHLVNANNYGDGQGGQEKFAFIPQSMLTDENRKGLTNGNKNTIGVPNFGVDAPWLVTTDYKYDFANKKVRVDTDYSKGMYAYGGLRMGGKGIYGLKLNNVDKPESLFTITPQTTGFEKIGQIWAQPTTAKIKTGASGEPLTGTDVLIFGGGYDMCYEHQKFQVGNTTDLDGMSDECKIKAQGGQSVDGNIVYMINARTGELIWKSDVTDMKSSVVARVTPLDRDNDGFMDHLYFADLGGEVYRADFKNAGFIESNGSKASNFSNKRVVRILKNDMTGADAKYAHRFYERPVVSFYRNQELNRLFAVVNVISGDRSSPLSKIREEEAHADRVYGIFDTDITKPRNTLYADNFGGTASNDPVQDTKDITVTNLAKLPDGIVPSNGFNQTEKNTSINKVRGKKGWYYPLTRFDGFSQVKYGKGVGKSEVIDGFLFTTVYNPDMDYFKDTSGCSAKIEGGSERQLYCLPYGICKDESSKSGTGGFIRAGAGIQELTLGPRSKNQSNQTVLIGIKTLSESIQGRVDFGDDPKKQEAGYSPLQGVAGGSTGGNNNGGDGTAPSLGFDKQLALVPKTWYEFK